MNYHFSKIVKVPFEQAITSVVEGLKREGFGILTDIDVKATLKNKLGAMKGATKNCTAEASVSIAGTAYALPMRKGTLGPDVVDIRTLYPVE